MTTYGTIPTSTSPGPATNLEYISRAKERIKAGLGTRRPWRLMFNLHSLGLPANFHDAITRIRGNLGYFRMNYAIVVLFVLFVSLFWHPISLIVFVAMMAVWLFLYFLRDEPLVLFGRQIGDQVVLVVLSLVTLVVLLLTRATWNIVTALLVAAAVVLLHAVVRRTDDLMPDEEAAGLMSQASTS